MNQALYDEALIRNATESSDVNFTFRSIARRRDAHHQSFNQSICFRDGVSARRDDNVI